MKGSLITPILLFASIAFAQNAVKPVQGPPPTRQDNVTEIFSGTTITDHYRWLEDQNSPETRAWIDSQNTYTHSLLDALPGREKLSKRFAALVKVENISSPSERNGRFFYYKRMPEQDQWVVYLREGENGKEEVLIDPNAMSPDHSTSVNMMAISKDGKVLAYAIRSGGKDETTVHLLDVDTRSDLPDRLPEHLYLDLSFLPDRSGFYYSLMTDDGPRLRFHKMGTETSADTDIFGKGYGKDVTVGGTPTHDGHYLVVQVYHGASADKTEIWLQNLAANGPVHPLVKDIDARFYALPAGDRLLIQTNWKAPHNRVLAVDLTEAEEGKGALEQWREVIPESSDAIADVEVAGGKILVSYTHNATSQIKVFADDGKPAGELSFPVPGSADIAAARWENRAAFISFSSYTVPQTIYRYDAQTSKQSIWAQKHIEVDSSKFQVRQVWFRSKDGTKVPMFLVYGKNIKLDGKNPTRLTGYGGFTDNVVPAFDPDTIIWIEHGGIFAEVNLRGGGEFGEAWHQAGMLAKKQNVFDDFIAASEWLIRNKYTQPAKLAISGASNGGLLVGAALTQRPDLYRAAICAYPLLDMLRYDQFLEAQFWVSEYGSAKNPEQFKWLYAYSPYQHVKAGTKYPAVLFITGDADTRVAPLHARKMTAELQADTGSANPILLRYELTAGHAGGQSVSNAIVEQTDTLSFLFSQLGVKP